MRIIVTLVFVVVMVAGCRRDRASIDNQDIYVVGNQRITLPFTLSNHTPHVECSINGKKAVVAIDTAASGVFLYQDGIEKFGVKVVGMSENEANTATESLKLEVGDECTFTFTDALSVRVEYPSILPRTSFFADGIVGASLLDGLDSVIDFRSNTITWGVEEYTEPNASAASP